MALVGRRVAAVLMVRFVCTLGWAAHASEPQVPSSLDREEVRRVVRSHLADLRHCYDEALAMSPALAGKVTVEWVVSHEGTVSSAMVVQSTTGSSQLDACVTARVLTWLFPKVKGGGVAVVTYPFVFTAPAPASVPKRDGG